jgi:hypothetical protein
LRGRVAEPGIQSGDFTERGSIRCERAHSDASDPAVVQPNVTYALQARITVDDRLWFTNDERYSVDPSKPEPAHLALKMVKQD